MGDAGACSLNFENTGQTIFGANATDIPDPSLVWPGQTECVVVSVPPRATSDWVDIGRLLDTLDHSYLNLPGANYSIEFGLMAEDGSGVQPIPNSRYDGQPDPRACNGDPSNRTLNKADESCWLTPSFQTVLLDASIRASRRTRPITSEFYGIMEDLRSRPPPHGKPPTEVMITADTFPADWARPMYAEGQGFPDPKWQRDVKEFVQMYGLTRAGTPPSRNSTTAFGEVAGCTPHVFLGT